MKTTDFTEKLENHRCEQVLLALVRGELVVIGGQTYRYARQGQGLCTHRRPGGCTWLDQALQSGVYVKATEQASDPDDDLPAYRWRWFSGLWPCVEVLVLTQLTDDEWQVMREQMGVSEGHAAS